MTPISCCLHTHYRLHPLYKLYTLTCCFSRFYTLLCALETVNTTYAIYFLLIHHCTNSFSSLHIFVHDCTFCASLHTKTRVVGRVQREGQTKESASRDKRPSPGYC